MSQSRFRTIVFDLDGTIADTAPDLAAALNHTLLTIDRTPLALDTVRTMIGHGTRALLRKGLGATGFVDEALVDASYPAFMQFYEDHICDLTSPYPNVEATLDSLSGDGIALALCTNKPERMSRLLIDKLGWQSHFKAIVAGDTLTVSKPDPAPLKLAIELAGGGPTLFVGDSIVDVETARAVGVPCVLVSFGFSDVPAKSLGADRVIDDMAELTSVLVSL